MTFIAYTDGAFSVSSRIGGWAWICEELHDSGFVAGTTNQRMEMLAVLKAVEHFEGERLHIVSDSAYVVNCFLDRWYESWMIRGWRKKGGGQVKNLDLWQPLIERVLHADGDVSFQHVRGHCGIEGNELADQLAVEARLRGERRQDVRAVG